MEQEGRREKVFYLLESDSSLAEAPPRSSPLLQISQWVRDTVVWWSLQVSAVERGTHQTNVLMLLSEVKLRP